MFFEAVPIKKKIFSILAANDEEEPFMKQLSLRAKWLFALIAAALALAVTASVLITPRAAGAQTDEAFFRTPAGWETVYEDDFDGRLAPGSAGSIWTVREGGPADGSEDAQWLDKNAEDAEAFASGDYAYYINQGFGGSASTNLQLGGKATDDYIIDFDLKHYPDDTKTAYWTDLYFRSGGSYTQYSFGLFFTGTSVVLHTYFGSGTDTTVAQQTGLDLSGWHHYTVTAIHRTVNVYIDYESTPALTYDYSSLDLADGERGGLDTGVIGIRNAASQSTRNYVPVAIDNVTVRAPKVEATTESFTLTGTDFLTDGKATRSYSTVNGTTTASATYEGGIELNGGQVALSNQVTSNATFEFSSPDFNGSNYNMSIILRGFYLNGQGTGTPMCNMTGYALRFTSNTSLDLMWINGWPSNPVSQNAGGNLILKTYTVSAVQGTIFRAVINENIFTLYSLDAEGEATQIDTAYDLAADGANRYRADHYLEAGCVGFRYWTSAAATTLLLNITSTAAEETKTIPGRTVYVGETNATVTYATGSVIAPTATGLGRYAVTSPVFGANAFTLTLPEGYEASQVTYNTHALTGSENSYAYNNPVTGATLAVGTQLKTYTVTFADDDGSSLSTQDVTHGSCATAPASPTKAPTAQYTYTFDNWYSGDDIYDFDTPVTADITLKAHYTQTVNRYELSMTAPEHGTLTLDPAAGEYDYGTQVTVSAAPSGEQYVLTAITVNGTPLAAQTDGSYTFTLTQDSVVAAAFALEGWHYLTIAPFENGSAAIGGTAYTAPVLLEDGSAVTLTVTPDEGYEVASVTLGTDALTAADGTYSFAMPASDATLTIQLRLKSYTVTFVDESGATLSEQTVTHGSAAQQPETPAMENTAQYTYTFDGWYSDDDVYDFDTPVIADITLTARFNRTVNRYTVTAEAAQNGSVTLSPAGPHDYGTTVTGTVTADEGYEIVRVTVNGEEVALENGAFTLTVTEDATVTAEFALAEEPEGGCGGVVGFTGAGVTLAAAALCITLILKKRRQ